MLLLFARPPPLRHNKYHRAAHYNFDPSSPCTVDVDSSSSLLPESSLKLENKILDSNNIAHFFFPPHPFCFSFSLLFQPKSSTPKNCSRRSRSRSAKSPSYLLPRARSSSHYCSYSKSCRRRRPWRQWEMKQEVVQRLEST
jgi:hypothetical protein